MRLKAKALTVAAAVALAACSQPPLPEDHFYRIEIGAPAEVLAGPPIEGTLEVIPFLADGLTAKRPIVYVESGQSAELRAYHYHFWTDPPTIMLRDALVDYLRAANLARTVVTPEMRIEPDFVLRGRIRRLERVLGGFSGVVVELELGLRRTVDDRLMMLDTYRVEAEAGDDSVAAFVAAVNRALADIYATFAAVLSGM